MSYTIHGRPMGDGVAGNNVGMVHWECHCGYIFAGGLRAGFNTTGGQTCPECGRLSGMWPPVAWEPDALRKQAELHHRWRCRIYPTVMEGRCG